MPDTAEAEIDNKALHREPIRFINKVLTIVGIAGIKPEISKWIFIRRNWLFFAQMLVLQTCYFGEIASIISSFKAGDLELVVSSSGAMTTVTVVNTKVLTMIWNCDLVYKLTKELEILWPEEPHTRRIDDITKKSSANLNVSIKVITFMYAVLILIFANIPLLGILYAYWNNLPIQLLNAFPVLYPFSINGPILYAVECLHQNIAAIFAGAAISGCDSFLYFCLINLSIQFEILASDLETLIENHHQKHAPDCTDDVDCSIEKKIMPYDEVEYCIPEEGELYKSLCDLVARHNRLIGLVGDLESVFSWTLLVNFICSSVLICLAGYLSIGNYKKNSTGALIEYAFAVPAKIIQIYLICWNGQQLITSSQKVGDAAYISQWYHASPKIKKTLFFIIHRSQKPMYLTAFGFSKLSFDSFCSIIKTAWSYFTLLNTLLD